MNYFEEALKVYKELLITLPNGTLKELELIFHNEEIKNKLLNEACENMEGKK